MFYVPEVADFNVGVWSNVHADLDNVVYLYKGYLRDGELIASDDDSSNVSDQYRPGSPHFI